MAADMGMDVTKPAPTANTSGHLESYAQKASPGAQELSSPPTPHFFGGGYISSSIGWGYKAPASLSVGLSFAEKASTITTAADARGNQVSTPLQYTFGRQSTGQFAGIRAISGDTSLVREQAPTLIEARESGATTSRTDHMFDQSQIGHAPEGSTLRRDLVSDEQAITTDARKIKIFQEHIYFVASPNTEASPGDQAIRSSGSSAGQDSTTEANTGLQEDDGEEHRPENTSPSVGDVTALTITQKLSEDKVASSPPPPSPPKSDESVETSMLSSDARDATLGLDYMLDQQSQPLEQGSAVTLGVDSSIDEQAATSAEARTRDVATTAETPTSEVTTPSGSLFFDEKSPIATEVSRIEATPSYVGDPSDQHSEAAFEETSPRTPPTSIKDNHKITKPPSPLRISYASVLKSPVQETNKVHPHRTVPVHKNHDTHLRMQEQGTFSSFTLQKTSSSQSAELQGDQAKTPQSKSSSSMPLSSDESSSDLVPPSPSLSGELPQVAPSLASSQYPAFSAPRPTKLQQKFVRGQFPNNLDDPSVDLRHLPVAPWCTRNPEFESPRDISYDEAHSHNWDMEEQLMRTRWHPTRYLRSQTEDGKDEEVPIRNTAARLIDLMPCKEFEEIGLFVPMPHAKHLERGKSNRQSSPAIKDVIEIFSLWDEGEVQVVEDEEPPMRTKTTRPTTATTGDNEISLVKAGKARAHEPSSSLLSSFAWEDAKSHREERKVRKAVKCALKQSTQDKSSSSSEAFSKTGKKNQESKGVGKRENFEREAPVKEEEVVGAFSSSIPILTRGQEQEDVEEETGAFGTATSKKRRGLKDEEAVGARLLSGRGTAKKRGI